MPKRLPFICGLLFSLGLFFVFASPSWLQPLKSSWWRLTSRPTGLVTEGATSSRTVIDVVRELRNLTLENQRLEGEKLQLAARLQELEQVSHENELLRAELDFVATNRTTFDFVPAEIISRSPSTYFQSIVVNRGAQQGLLVGQIATSSGFMIGRVESVTDGTATIRLITASRSLVPITLATSRATGLLKGGLAGLTAEDLPNDLTIVPGEGVVTSGLGGEVPSGIPLGTVDRVLNAETDFIQRAAIHSPIKFSKLELILILKPKIS
jgi:rod shape-determining protein MreC